MWTNVTTNVLTIVSPSIRFNFQLIYFLPPFISFFSFKYVIDILILDNDLGRAERESQLLGRAGTPAEEKSSPLISPSLSLILHSPCPALSSFYYSYLQSLFSIFFSSLSFFLLSYLCYSPIISTSLISHLLLSSHRLS